MTSVKTDTAATRRILMALAGTDAAKLARVDRDAFEEIADEVLLGDDDAIKPFIEALEEIANERPHIESEGLVRKARDEGLVGLSIEDLVAVCSDLATFQAVREALQERMNAVSEAEIQESYQLWLEKSGAGASDQAGQPKQGGESGERGNLVQEPSPRPSIYQWIRDWLLGVLSPGAFPPGYAYARFPSDDETTPTPLGAESKDSRQRKYIETWDAEWSQVRLPINNSGAVVVYPALALLDAPDRVRIRHVNGEVDPLAPNKEGTFNIAVETRRLRAGCSAVVFMLSAEPTPTVWDAGKKSLFFNGPLIWNDVFKYVIKLD